MGTDQPKVTGAPDDTRDVRADEQSTDGQSTVDRDAASAGEDTPAGRSGATGGAHPADGDEPTDRGDATKGEPATTVEEPTGGGKPTDGEGPADGDESTDRWAAFAPASEPVPGRLRRIGRAIGRPLIHEWTLATVASLALAVLMTWPTLRYPLHTIPQDTWDPTLQAWQMAWSGHILLTDPAQLWHSNAFYPLSWSFAFSDTLLGYAPAGMIGEGPAAAVLRYNIMFVLAHALAALGAYALVRQLGSGRVGAAVAGAAYAYAPWLLAQAGHLHVISNGGIPLALAMLARGHGWSMRYGYRPDRRRAGWALAGWLVAAWQISLGFGIGLPFAYVLALIVVAAPVAWWIRRTWFWAVKRPFGVKLLLTDLLGGLIFAAVGLALAVPYFKVAEQHPNAKRTVAELALFSPPANGFLTAPAESWLWGEAHAEARAALPFQPEMTLLPGFTLYGLAIAGLFFSIWTVRQRMLLLAGVLVTGVLAMGTQFFGGTYTYLPLFENLPGWEGLRTPGRLLIWTTLLLGVLAAGAVSAFADRVGEFAAQRVPPWPGPWLRLAMLLPLVLVLVEGINVTPHPIVPRQPVAMRTVSGPLLVLPSNQSWDQHAMLWSTSHFQPLVNGGSGFTPQQLAEIRQRTASFPDEASVSYLRELGVRTVVVLRDRIAGTPLQTTVDLPVVDHLGVDREYVENTVVFRL